jgi:hypothetical protein
MASIPMFPKMSQNLSLWIDYKPSEEADMQKIDYMNIPSMLSK